MPNEDNFKNGGDGGYRFSLEQYNQSAKEAERIINQEEVPATVPNVPVGSPARGPTGFPPVNGTIPYFTGPMMTPNAMSMPRKHRKFERWNIMEANGVIYPVACYNDRSTEVKTQPLFLNAAAPITVRSVDFVGGTAVKKDDWIAVCFGSQPGAPGSHTVLMERKTVEQGKKLMTLLRRKGIQFGSDLDKENIAILQKILLPMVEHPDGEIRVHVQPGWDNEMEYHDRERHPELEHVFTPEDAPVLSHSFTTAAAQDNQIDLYLDTLRMMFHQMKDRVAMLLTLITSFLFTLMCHARKRPAFVVNCVASDNLPISMIAGLLQVFNRSQRMASVDSTLSQKQFLGQIAKYKDDIILVDSRHGLEEENYISRKRRSNTAVLMEAVQNCDLLPDGTEPGAVVVIVSSEFRSGNVVNILLPKRDALDHDLLQKAMDLQAVEAVLTVTRAYIEKNRETVSTLLHKTMDCAPREVPLRTAWLLMERVFSEVGYDLGHEFGGFSVEQIGALYVDGDWSIDAAIPSFVQLVRKAMATTIFLHRMVAKRNNVRFLSEAIYYNRHYVFFSVNLMESLFKRMRRLSYLPIMLTELRKEGLLETDQGQLTKKLSFQGKRVEYYAVCRELLTPEYFSDFLLLGDQTSDAQRKSYSRALNYMSYIRKLATQAGQLVDFEGHPVFPTGRPSPHALVTGGSGTGKTFYLFHTAVHEAKCKRVVIIDSSGSYTLREMKKHKIQPDLINVCEDICLELTAASVEEAASDIVDALQEAFEIKSAYQLEILRTCVDVQLQWRKAFHFAGLFHMLENYTDANEADKRQEDNVMLLLERFRPFASVTGFTVVMTEPPTDRNTKGLDIYQLSQRQSNHREKLTAFILSLIWAETRRQNGVPFCNLLLLDEIQNLPLGENSSLKAMLKEARKYGLQLLLATQFITSFPSDTQEALLQCGSKLFFRPTERGMGKISELISGNSKKMVPVLRGLKRGEAIHVGEFRLNVYSGTSSEPILVRVKS